MPTKKRDSEHVREYDRGMLRSAFVSLFWAVISERRKKGFKLQHLADALPTNKSVVSRWFSGQPNWRLNTVSDIAGVLNLDLHIQARDRETGVVYAPYGRALSVHFQTDGQKAVPLTETAGSRDRSIEKIAVYSDLPTTRT